MPAASLGPAMTRRRAAAWLGAGLGLVLLAACGSGEPWHALDVSDSSPPLALTMTRASDGREVTAADYRGRVVMLYFGYTFCPDICPTTLANMAAILEPAAAQEAEACPRPLRDRRSGARHSACARGLRQELRAPDRRSARYAGPAGRRLARRYRIASSVTPETKRSLSRGDPQLGDLRLRRFGRRPACWSPRSGPREAGRGLGTAADLKQLVEETAPQGWFARLQRWL